jgi:hypothetical protein
MNRLQVVTHFMDGSPSETRDMTDEELAQLIPKGSITFPEEPIDETPSPA